MKCLMTLLVLCVVGPGGAVAGETGPADDGSGRVIAGDDVRLGGSIDGNAIMAGGRSQIEGHVHGDVVLAGGTVDVRGKVDEGVYAAGGDVRIDARVDRDLMAAGGTVLVTRAAEVAGDATLAGGNITIDGHVGRKLRAFAASVALNGRVDGDVEVAAEHVRIGPEARIAGRLVYHSPDRPDIAPGAVIAGGVERSRRGFSGLSPESGVGLVVAGVFRAFWFAGVLLVGALLILTLPRFSREAAATVGSDALASLALGFAMLVAVPLAAIMLFITIIGIPLGIGMLFAYGLLLMLGYVTAAIFVGDGVLRRIRTVDAGSGGWRILFLLVALVLIALLRLVPWIGDLAVFVLFLAGLGAFTLRCFRGYRSTA